jgi:hypothetical protein
VVRSQIVDEFNLNGQVDITLDVEPAGAGVIKISTITPKTYPWTGVYFDGVPVTVTAIANPGYVFANWNNDTLTHAELELNVTEATTMLAVFKPNYIPFGSNVKVYPNPATSSLEIIYEANNGTDLATIQVIDVNGRVVLVDDVESVNDVVLHDIDVSNLPNGYYIVAITQGSTVSKKSFIKI